MTPKQRVISYDAALRLLEGWTAYRDMIKNVQGEAGELKRQATERRIAECKDRLAKLEAMKGAKSADR